MLTAAVLILLGIALVPVALYVLAKRPQLFLILVIPPQVLLGGAERGSVVTGLRAGEVVLAICLGSLILSRPWKWERIRDSPAARAVALYALTGFLLPVLGWRLRGHAITPAVIQAYAP